MKSNRPHRDFVEALIAQEDRISPVQLAEYRRSLDRRLEAAQARERRMRIALACTSSIVLAGVGLFLAMAMIAPPGVWPLQPLVQPLPEWAKFVVLGAVWVVFGTAIICLVPFALLYWLRYGRQARQAREEYILLTLSELQREVAQLRERIQSGSGE